MRTLDAWGGSSARVQIARTMTGRIGAQSRCPQALLERAPRLGSAPIGPSVELVLVQVLVMGIAIRGARVQCQKLPVAISESSKARGRSPRAVASTTIQERSRRRMIAIKPATTALTAHVQIPKPQTSCAQLSV